MSLDSNVTYEVVRRACCDLLASGVKPARPSVQEVLARADYLGHKGSNAVVQKLINEFWNEVGDRLNTPVRPVDGIPEAYVTTIDKALADMVAISRRIADEEMASREAALGQQEAEMTAELRAARDSAAAAEQLLLRTEGERNALEKRLREQAAELTQSRKDVQSGLERESGLTIGVRERDVQIKHLDAALAAAKEFAGATQVQHEAEVRRLLLQIDEARHNALLEAAAAKLLNARIGTLEQKLATARAHLDAAGVQIAALQSEVAQKGGRLRARAAASPAAVRLMTRLRSRLAKVAQTSQINLEEL